ncbi:hypothetical protein [Syntrophaceticus schinkii]|jgi:hypothetical protein|nr:hypothetical protein [Syntrophaceticus schinkii]
MLITYGSICSPLRTYNELNGVGEEKLEEELMGGEHAIICAAL